MTIKNISLFILVSTILVSSNSFGAKGDLDLNFGDGSIPATSVLWYPTPCGIDDSDIEVTAKDFALNSNNIYVSLSLSEKITFKPRGDAVVKLDLNGKLDKSFASNGFYCETDNIQMLVTDDKNNLLVIEPHISASGTNIGNRRGVAISRLNDKGQLDENFGYQGKTGAYWSYEPSSGPGFGLISNIKQLDNEDFKITGHILYPSLAIHPFEFESSQEGKTPSITRFSNQVSGEQNAGGQGAVILGNGDWFQTLSSYKTLSPEELVYKTFVRKFFSNGDIDINFGINGDLSLAPETISFEPIQMTETRYQKLLVLGKSYLLNDSDNRFIRINSLGYDGILDDQFANNGSLEIKLPNQKLTTNENEREIALSSILVTQSDEILTSIFYRQTISDNTDSNIFRENKLNILMATDSNGVILNDIFTNGIKDLGISFDTRQMLQQKDGRVLLLGTCAVGSNRVFCLQRINWDNKSEIAPVSPTANSGGGSITHLFVLFGIIIFRLRKETSKLNRLKK